MATLGRPSALLLQAINHADRATLQSVLKSMCETSSECAAAASQRFLVSRVNDVVSIDHSGDDTDQRPARKKQKLDTHDPAPVSRYETCATCHKRFDITDNPEDACQQHDGDLEVDAECFPDDDDIQAGEEIDVNSDWRVDECPHGFIWSCCEENAKGPPCVVQRHIIMTR